MTKNFFGAILLLCLLFPQPQSFAWGRKGHELIIELAFSRLTPNEQQKILRYLDGMTIQSASTWLDEIRNDKRYKYLETAHYINIPAPNGPTKIAENDIQRELNRTLLEVKSLSSLPDSVIKLDLLKLIHLVGDIHQPLHAGYEVDRGGNDITVLFNGKKTNLHRLWDSQLIESLNIDSSSVSAHLASMSRKQKVEYSKTDVALWIKDSQLHLEGIYQFQNGNIDDKYVTDAKPVIEKQLAKAVLRLERVLKRML
jgi:S1/P1 Nuclease